MEISHWQSPRRGGRPKLPGNARKVALAKKLYQEKLPVKDICRDLAISRPTLYRYLKLGK